MSPILIYPACGYIVLTLRASYKVFPQNLWMAVKPCSLNGCEDLVHTFPSGLWKKVFFIFSFAYKPRKFIAKYYTTHNELPRLRYLLQVLRTQTTTVYCRIPIVTLNPTYDILLYNLRLFLLPIINCAWIYLSVIIIGLYRFVNIMCAITFPNLCCMSALHGMTETLLKWRENCSWQPTGMHVLPPRCEYLPYSFARICTVQHC